MSTVQRPRFLFALTLLGLTGLLLSMSPALRAAEPSLPALQASPNWQARLQLSSLALNAATAPGGLDSAAHAGSRLLSATLLGDYYLTGSGLGGVRGGLRATGGLMLGSLAQSNASLALNSSTTSLAQGLTVGQRSLTPWSAERESSDPFTSTSYLGIGYTGRSLRGGWGFSADLGLMSGNMSGNGLRLGNNRAQSMEDLLRDLRFKPVLQLGLSYSY
ncbi:hypothetical protein [Roseateles sp.]|uniref:hypothetical protein n=1 Tax=Roseateles sp. TaxID=1971397 RepID=UPI003BA58B59